MRAIQNASPLPAPPDAAVFSNVLTLEFDSQSFIVGGSPEGFEPLSSLTTAAGYPGRSIVRVEQAGIPDARHRTGDLPVIKLTIIGTPRGPTSPLGTSAAMPEAQPGTGETSRPMLVPGDSPALISPDSVSPDPAVSGMSNVAQ